MSLLSSESPSPSLPPLEARGPKDLKHVGKYLTTELSALPWSTLLKTDLLKENVF